MEVWPDCSAVGCTHAAVHRTGRCLFHDEEVPERIWGECLEGCRKYPESAIGQYCEWCEGIILERVV